MTELVGTFTNVESDLPTKPKLAMDGGPQAIKHPLPPMYPGGMRIGAEEEKAVLDVIRSKRLFRYYGPYSGGSKVDEFEKAFAAYMKTGHAVAVSSGSASLVCGLAGRGRVANRRMATLSRVEPTGCALRKGCRRMIDRSGARSE